MNGWELAGTIAAVWFAASFVIAIGCALISKTRKPAPEPPLSDGAVDAIFDQLVQDLKSKGGAS
jgi:hypothetical protein